MNEWAKADALNDSGHGDRSTTLSRGRTSDGSHRGSSCPTVEIFEEMAGKARSLGDQIINEETALEMAFRGETIDETDLRSRSRIAALWGVSQFDGKNAGWRPANIHG